MILISIQKVLTFLHASYQSLQQGYYEITKFLCWQMPPLQSAIINYVQYVIMVIIMPIHCKPSYHEDPAVT